MAWLMVPPLLLIAFGGGLAAAGALSLSRSRSEAVLRAVVVVGALTMVWAPGAPTLIGWWDALLRIGWCGVVAWSAAYARRPLTVAVLGVTAAIAAVTGSVAPLALAAAGLGAFAAGQQIGGRARVPRAIAGVALANALVRLEWHDPHGASAVLGAVTTVALVATALRAARPARRRIALRVVGVAGGAVGALCVAALFAGLAASSELRQGMVAGSRAIDAAERGDTASAAPQFADADRHFHAAAAAVDGIAGRVGRYAPVVGSHLRAGSMVAGTGRSLAAAGADVAGGFSTRELTVRDGRIDPAVAGALAARLHRSLPVVDRAARDLRAADSPWLLPPVGRRLGVEAHRLARLQREAEVVGAAADELPGLVGAGGERRYFLAVFTPAEARGLGGFLGNYGEVVAADGRLGLERIGRTRELNQAAVASGATLDGAPGEYVARYSRYAPEVTWQNVSMSPDFPTVADVIRRLYPVSGGRHVDGVIAIDPIGLASLLKVTGPVVVAPWPEPLTASNAERVLLHEQYLRFDDERRVTFLGDVARAVTDRLVATEVEPRRLLAAVMPAVAGHHLMLNSATPSEQRLLQRVGVAGHLQRDGAADFLAVTNQNAGGNKIDWFLHRSYRYTPTVDATGRIAATLDLSLENGAPASGLPDDVIGNVSTPADPPGTNRTFVSVYTPLVARTATLDGHPVLFDSERELGLNVYTFYVPVGASATSHVRLDLAGAVDGVTSANYRLQVYRPGLIAPDDVTLTMRGRAVAHRLDRSRLFAGAAG
jgi:hypothetical protein